MTFLTDFALRNRTLIALITVMIIVLGPVSFFSHPSREDPEIVIRTAQVHARFEGMSPERVENLITQKIEEKVREIGEVEHIVTTSQNSASIVRVIVYDRYKDMDPIWQDLRNKMEEVKRELPDGTRGPDVNDDYGEVAMATVAMTVEGYSLAEMRRAARWLRNKLYSTPGVKKIELFGIEPERIYVEFDNIRLAQFGISAASVVEAVQKQNIVLPGGKIEAQGETW